MILFLGQLPPPVHGVTLLNSYLVNSAIVRSNFQIDVINLQFEFSLHKLGKFSVRKFTKAIAYGFEVVKKTLNIKPDIVYFTLVPTGFAFYRDAYYVLLLKLFRSNILIHLHGKGIEENCRNSIIKRKLYSWILKNTHIICLSTELAKDIRGVYNIPPFIVSNGIEVQPYFNPETQRAQNNVPQILYLSNYVKSKGILILIEALSILSSKGFKFHARFVGAPFDVSVKMIEDQLMEHNLTSFADVLGPLTGEDKLAEYKRADIFVFPTMFEAFGLVNLEAMQYSLPVISTFEGSIPDIVIDGETGFLVEKQNSEMLADKIAILLADKDLRNSMGRKGYDRFIKNYTLQHFESNMNEIFHNVLSSKHRTSTSISSAHGG